MNKALVLFLVITTISIHSQSFYVYDIDTTNYPVMKGKFYLYNKSWKQITNTAITDFEVKENFDIRSVISVGCPPIKPPVALSSVLVTDISPSMEGNNMILIKEGVKAWMRVLPANKSECALTAFNMNSFLIQDFTTDRNKILEKIEKLIVAPGTNYTAAFMANPTGAIRVAKRGAYKRIIIFISDGEPNYEPQTLDIINNAIANRISIYAITLENQSPQCLRDMAINTGGSWFEKVTTVEQIEAIYANILNLATGNEPCEIEWESGQHCDVNRINLEIRYKPLNIVFKHDYVPSFNSVARLGIVPNAVKFNRVIPGTQKDTTITVKSENIKLSVTKIKSSNGSFSVIPENFSLEPGQSIDVTLRFKPADSSFQYTEIEFENNYCPLKLHAYGGFPGKKPKVTPLRITSPNGGDFFVAGSDTLVTWEGVLPTDTVKLFYSLDSGVNWKLLTEKATGYKYAWKNIPKTPSNKCLAKVTYNTDMSTFVEWEKSVGGSYVDEFSDIIVTSDGGYIAVGSSFSNNNDVPVNKGGKDIYMVKLNAAGNIEWKKSFGGSLNDFSTSVIETRDGNFLIAGGTYSTDKDVKINRGDFDAWVIKTNKTGDMLWQKTYGGRNNDYFSNVINAWLDGYILAGTTESEENLKSKNYCNPAYWVMKINDTGAVAWEKLYGGSGYDYANSIIRTSDGGYIGTGRTSSDDGDIDTNYGNYDYWVVKLTNMINKSWTKTYGGTYGEEAKSIIELEGTGYVVAGNGSSSGNLSNYWVLNLDYSGNIKWQKTYGGSGIEMCMDLSRTSDGGFILCGWSSSTDGDVTGSKGHTDCWVVKTDGNGDIEWQRTLGGSSYEYGLKAKETSDGGFIIGSNSDSKDGDVTGNHGASDIWIVKLLPLGFSMSDESDSLWAIVMPEAAGKDVEMGKVFVGNEKDSVVHEFIINTGSYPFTVDTVFIEGKDKSAFSVFTYSIPGIVNPSKNEPCRFMFKPASPGLFEAQIFVVTQTDTLRQKITGEGVLPVYQVLNNIIDFGVVETGGFKDSIHAATIKNIGIIPLEIKETRHTKPNDIDFSTVAGYGPFVLQPGDTAFLDLRFSPAEEGRTSGMLEFHYDGFGSPAIVQLYGEGINTNPVIQYNQPEFADLICNNSSVAGFDITNKGRKNLVINSIEFLGTNPADYALNAVFPIITEPDSTVTLNILFNPVTAGQKSAIMIVKSNADPDSILTIPLISRKDSIRLFTDISVISLGVLCPGEMKDTSLSVINNGNVKTGAYVTYSTLLETDKEFVVDSGGTHSIPLSFTGMPDEGKICEKITVTDSICGRQYEVIITGDILKPVIQIDDLTLNAIIGSSSEGNLTIRNVSGRDCILNMDSPLQLPFSLKGNPFPLFVPANGQSTISIIYTPDDLLSDNMSINFNVMPCSTESSALITGETSTASATLYVPDIEAYPGEIVDIPVILKNEQNLRGSNIEKFNVELNFNTTLLAPVDYPCQLSGENAGFVELNNLPADIVAGTSLATIKFKVGLGNSAICNLLLTEAQAIGGTASLSVESGTFRLLGICPEGGNRLINPSGSTQILSIRPNPASETAEIEVELIESGLSKLYISDIMGREVITIFERENFNYGVTNVKTDISSLGAGIFFVVLKSATVNQTAILVVGN